MTLTIVARQCAVDRAHRWLTCRSRWLRRIGPVGAVVLGFVLLFSMSVATETRAEDDAITPQKPWFSFSATPFLAPTNMAQAVVGVKEKMEFVLKARVRFGTSFDTDAFRARLAGAEDDFVLIYPTEYALAEQHGYLPLVQLKSPYKVYFVVPVSSSLRFMSDLRGKLLLVPGNGSPAEGLAKQTLEESDLAWNRDVFVKTLRTDGIGIREMLSGPADACVASRMPTRIIQRERELKLRSLGESPPLPPVLFAAHRRVSDELRNKLRSALISLGNTESGRARLRQLGVESLVAFDPAAYQELDACAGADCDPLPPAVNAASSAPN